MPEWTRPYHEDRFPMVYVVAVLMSVAGLVPLCGVVATSSTGPGLIAVLVFSALWQVALWRVVLVGLYLGERGIKVRMLLRTTVIPWSQVVRARLGPATGFRSARAIWIVVHDDDAVETPIWQSGRPHQRNRVKLPPGELAALVDRLTQAARSH